MKAFAGPLALLALFAFPAFAGPGGPAVSTEKDLMQSAGGLSAAGRYEEAVSVLREVLGDNPKNLDARVQLAKVLSWSRRFEEAEQEADAVLAADPGSADAMLVKANILRWRGEAGGAASLYLQVLEQQEYFDARLGLAYAELAAGRRKKAEAAAGLLKPANESQVRERDRLQTALREAGRLSSSAGLGYYEDSDGNWVDVYDLTLDFPVAGARSDFLYRQVHAFDKPGSESAEEEYLKIYRKQGRIGSGAGIGYVHAGQGEAPYIVTGHVRADLGVRGWTVGAAASKNAFTETALLIRNRITRKSGEVFAFQDFASGYALSGNYRNAEYSDNNRSQDALLRADYVVSSAHPAIRISYLLRYLDFDRQSGGGYFDPQRLNSNQIQAAVSAEAGRVRVSLEPALGYQEFSRFGTRDHQSVYSVRAAAVYAFRNNISVEVSGESGKSGEGIVSAYRYSAARALLTATF